MARVRGVEGFFISLQPPTHMRYSSLKTGTWTKVKVWVNVTSSPRDEFQELVALSWVALGQATGSREPVDEETMRFFATASSPSLVPQRAPVVPRSPIVQRLPQKKSVPSAAPPPAAQVIDEAVVSTPSDKEDPPLPSSQTRRLEKLLPRSPMGTATDTAAVRKQILAKSASGCLSETPLYEDPPPKSGPKRWAVFTYLTPTEPPTPREAFVRSVVSAIGERLQVNVREHSCTDPLFALQLPMAADDSELVMLFVEAHLESALLGLLEPIHSFVRSSQGLEPPFSVIGAINGKPIRTLVLHPSTHEDQAVKSQLWQSLKALATLNSPY
jgi:hypothetical protein